MAIYPHFRTGHLIQLTLDSRFMDNLAEPIPGQTGIDYAQRARQITHIRLRRTVGSE
jgi:hypothetical protein